MEPYELRRGRYKNLTLRLIPPEGRIRVTAPWFVPKPFVDRFVAEREAWITEKRQALPRVEGPPAVDHVWVWGRRCRVQVESPGRLPRVVHNADEDLVVLRVPQAWDEGRRRRLLDRWEAQRVREALQVLVPLWSGKTGQRVDSWTVKTLRSRWGSCRPDARRLVLNARLGAYPPHCLVHVLVHELAHLVEPGHNKRFHAIVEGWLPGAAEVHRLLRAGLEAAGSAERGASPAPRSTREAETAP